MDKKKNDYGNYKTLQKVRRIGKWVSILSFVLFSLMFVVNNILLSITGDEAFKIAIENLVFFTDHFQYYWVVLSVFVGLGSLVTSLQSTMLGGMLSKFITPVIPEEQPQDFPVGKVDK